MTSITPLYALFPWPFTTVQIFWHMPTKHRCRHAPVDRALKRYEGKESRRSRSDCLKTVDISMPHQRNDGLPRVSPEADDPKTEPGSEFGSGLAGGMLKRVVGTLADCRAHLVSLAPPWVSQIRGGWFCVYFIRAGACQLVCGRSSTPLQIQSGDTVILPQCREHRLRDADTTEWSHSNQISLFDESHDVGNVRSAEGHRQIVTKIVAGRFPKPNKEIKLPLHVLPETLICKHRDAESHAGMTSTVGALEQEMMRPLVSAGIVEHLVKALILQATRGCDQRMPILRATNQTAAPDMPIVKALDLMHSRLEATWTVASLASAVGVSRSTFAARFLSQVGMTPLNYLRQERMLQASDLLCDESLGIKEVSMLVGYTSESAFSNTFKQWSGTTPGLFRRDRQR